MILNIVGAILLIGGTLAAFRLAPRSEPVPPADWYPDPSTRAPRQRFWDGRAWTGRVADGAAPAPHGHRFRGRFWGPWVAYAGTAAAVLLAGSITYRATGNVHVIAVASLLAMSGTCWAFYRFVSRQIALDDVVGQRQVLAASIGAAGATLLIAANANSWIIETAGIRTATATVGFVEEGAKFLVPLVLFLLGTYRDPRAGVALGMAGGFGFAVTETTQYAYQTAAASGPNFCGTSVDVTTGMVIQEQLLRIATVSPLHWLWAGIATAIAWRMWHLYGRRGTVGAVAGLLMVMVIHSANDSSATAFCDNPGAGILAALLRFVLLVVIYVVFRAWTRKSTPPQLTGKVTKAWTPKHLPRATAQGPQASEVASLPEQALPGE